MDLLILLWYYFKKKKRIFEGDLVGGKNIKGAEGLITLSWILFLLSFTRILFYFSLAIDQYS